MRWYLVLGVFIVLEAGLISGQKQNAGAGSSSTNENTGQNGPAGAHPRPPAQKPKAPTPIETSPGAKADDSQSTTDSQSATETPAEVAALSEKLGWDKEKKAKILVVLPLPFYSHTKNYMPIFKELARRGHNITMVSPYPQKETLSNWEDIVTENVLEKMWAKLPTRDFTEMSQSFIARLLGPILFADLSVELYTGMAPVQELYHDNSREFDLVFVEAQFIQEPLLAFGWKYKAPVIALYPSYIVPELAYYTGNPVFTTNYVPNMYFAASNHMNLYQRFENAAYAVLKLILYNSYYLPKMDFYMREHYPSDDRPYIADLLFNVSFTLLDSNPVLTYPYPRANNIREFLGINAKPDTPLGPDLQKLLDEADEEGVVLFTLGSHYQTSTLKPHILQSILYAFSKIPHKVIMKWDKDEPPPNLPSNVRIVKWVPQAGILRHKNCRAFFTHTGVHGVMEAMEHGVPIISLPLFADQDFFAAWAEANGVGRILDHKSITPDIALSVVQEVLSNPTYKEAAVGVSMKLKDVPQPTIDEVVYWVEHVLRTKGARHLRPGSLNLWWYQRFGLDVLAIALVLILVPIWVVFTIIKCLCSMCRGKVKTSEEEKKQMKRKKEK